MKRLAALILLLPAPVMANCIPPWQTHFSCYIPERNAQAEFCRIADTDAHPGKKEGYYSYVVGAELAELYFETDRIGFSVKDTNIDHPTDMTMAMGYMRDDWVYAFVVTFVLLKLVGAVMPLLEFIPFTSTWAGAIIATYALAITVRDGFLALAFVGLVSAVAGAGFYFLM
jgi:hypothetical protein